MRTVAVVWGVLALAATALLGVAGTFAGRWPEGVHLVGHVALCGGLAAMVAASIPGSPVRAGLGGLAAAVALGVGIELLQLRYHPPAGEVLYDLAVDGLAGVAGIGLAGVGRSRRQGTGHLVSALLHPVGIAPVGFGVAVFAATRDLATSARWTAALAACVLPAVLVWSVGIAARWWSDADVSVRSQRWPLFGLGLVGLLGLVWVVRGAPEPVAGIAYVVVLAGIVGSAVTGLGLKVSGHVAVPAVLATCAVSPRAAGLLIAAAVLVSAARLAARRHRPEEVAAAWGIAGFGLLFAGT